MFPFIFESNFEQGDASEWDSEDDTGSLLDFPHYSDLAKIPNMPAPFRGANCMRVRPGDANDHILLQGAIDISDEGTAHFRFYLFVSKDFTATADDVFNILELQQAGGTPESSLGMRITEATNLLEIGIGDGTAPTSFVEFERGRWVCVELEAKISTTSVGTLTLRIDGGSVIALTSLTNAAAVGLGQLGTTLTLATTTGTILFDQFVMDDARLFPIVDRFKKNVHLTKSGHAFIGPGTIRRISLEAGAAIDNVIKIFDTDKGNVNDADNEVYKAGNDVASESTDFVVGEIKVTRGAFVQLSGTTPRCVIGFDAANSMSEGAIRTYGARRSPGPQNT